MSGAYSRALERQTGSGRAALDPDTARRLIRARLGPDQLAVLDDLHRFVATITPRGAGKTTCYVNDCLDRMAETPGGRFIYGGLTKDSGIENTIDEFRRRDADLGLGLHIREDAGVIRLPENGAQVRVRSLETKAEVDKLRGKQFDGLYLDECQSVQDRVLRYAITQVIPGTLGRRRGRLKITGTPTQTPVGYWHAITSKAGCVVRRFMNGSERAISRPFRERNDPRWNDVLWTWSLHNWARSANPAMQDADVESQYMKDALAVSLEDLAALEAEFGDWPDDDPRGREFKFNPLTDVWVPGERVVGNPYGMPGRHDWLYTMGCDLGFDDEFALTVGACARTSRIGYHCHEDGGSDLTIAKMAEMINAQRALLGNRLIRIIGDSSGPTGHEIFMRLQIEHKIPIEPAIKKDKDDGVKLLSSDIVEGRMKILAGSRVANQLENLRKGPDGKRLRGQPDDFADSMLYTRRGMIHWATGAEAEPSAEQEAARRARERELLEKHRKTHEQMEGYNGRWANGGRWDEGH